jgi:glycerol-3-phosphate acyltransferase PlsY
VNAFWLIPIGAYLLGAIPFGLLIVWLSHRRDVRAEGSGNIGATNVARVAGSGAGLLTLVLDAAKGYAAVALAGVITGHNIRWMMLAAVCALVGHVFPVWLRFHGGRGVATGLGVLLLISAPAILTALLIWFLVIIFWRYVSLGSVAAAAITPLLMYVLYQPGYAPPNAVTWGTVAICTLIIARHAENMRRMAAGTEKQFSLGRPGSSSESSSPD